MRLASLPFFFLALGVLPNCGAIDQATEENGADAALFAGLPAITGAALQLSTQAQVLTGSTLSTTRTVGCGLSAATDFCATGGRKSASYPNCTAGGSEQIYEGSVLLQYSDTSGCTLNDQGENVTRTLSITRTLQYSDYPRFNDTVLTTTTEEHSDYRGVEYGSGTRLTRVASSPDTFELEILGVHKVLTNSKGRKVYDVSIRTTTAVTVSGDVGTDRTLSGGAIELVHNTAEYVATITPSGLRYHSTACCHPVSGTLSVEFSGKVLGTGTITFSSTCGRATLDREGALTDLALHGCE